MVEHELYDSKLRVPRGVHRVAPPIAHDSVAVDRDDTAGGP